jgi:hypothetical protein
MNTRANSLDYLVVNANHRIVKTRAFKESQDLTIRLRVVRTIHLYRGRP